MKMGEVLIGLLIVAMGFGGGYFTGAKVEKKKSEQHLFEMLENTDKVVNQLNSKIDSLSNLPAKVDTVIVNTEIIIEKTDTLILMSNDIYKNTDTIKNELRRFIGKHE
jgi:glutaredoxin 2